MTPPDTEGLTMFARIVSTGGPIVAVLVAPVIWIETRLRGKADKGDTQKHIQKLYENAEADRKQTRDMVDANHREVMNLLLQHFNHNGAKQ